MGASRSSCRRDTSACITAAERSRSREAVVPFQVPRSARHIGRRCRREPAGDSDRPQTEPRVRRGMHAEFPDGSTGVRRLCYHSTCPLIRTGSAVDFHTSTRSRRCHSRSIRLDALPGKPLADIDGRPMIEHVYRRASASPWCHRSLSRPTTFGLRRGCVRSAGT